MWQRAAHARTELQGSLAAAVGSSSAVHTSLVRIRVQVTRHRARTILRPIFDRFLPSRVELFGIAATLPISEGLKKTARMRTIKFIMVQMERVAAL